MIDRVRAFCALVSLSPGLVLATHAAAQSDGPLADERATAAAENQRVLIHLKGGDKALDAALAQAMKKELRRLLLYEYQVVATEADGTRAAEIGRDLGLGSSMALPALVVATPDGEWAATLTADGMVEDSALSTDRVQRFLNQHKAQPLDARAVLAKGLATAKRKDVHAFVYLSAPW